MVLLYIRLLLALGLCLQASGQDNLGHSNGYMTLMMKNFNTQIVRNAQVLVSETSWRHLRLPSLRLPFQTSSKRPVPFRKRHCSVSS
ncbi:hypothetical protein BJ878DRAFT_509921 [Calycina marina]|uniref:Uncharacterized protein n=1 Tax=Calycina marina TaxID=1763456 RepID=A0A9P7Z122_9HELO|nr:hypothetical protein BJ878DRAFT_509921 [Calycina marina]